MSGFIAIVNTNGAPVDTSLLERLTTSLNFKGPDKQKVWINGSVGFGHTLFRTTDEAQYENQPASLDGKVWITGSIRVDGREELVNKLGLTAKVQLNRTPDSELVLLAYRAWSEKCLHHLLGDFAFVIWDEHKKQLFCAKDHFGMRQLYYSQMGNTFVVSNSMHCMHQHPAITKQLNEQAIGDFLLFGDHCWMDKAQTSFSGIQSLLPAHSLELKGKAINIQRYWNLPTDIPLLRYRSEKNYIEHFQEIFKIAVSDRLRTSDITIKLSGGMDSSSIAATIGEIKSDVGQVTNLHASTVLYDSIHPSDERYYTELVARHLNLSPHYIDGGKYPLLTPAVQTTRPIELYQPALWLELEREALTQSRVILTGEAGDNLLTFSSVLKSLKEDNPIKVLLATSHLRAIYGTFPRLGSGLLAKMSQLNRKKALSNIPYPEWFNSKFEDEFKLKQRWSEWVSWQPPPLNQRYSHIYYSLVRPEWNTDDVYMYSNFTQPEKRDPFLDIRLFEFIASLPALPWLFNKHLLRKSMEGKLPLDITKRPKTFLGTLYSSLIRQVEPTELNNWQKTAELYKFIDRKKVPFFGNSHGSENEYLNLRPIILNSWIRKLY